METQRYSTYISTALAHHAGKQGTFFLQEIPFELGTKIIGMIQSMRKIIDLRLVCKGWKHLVESDLVWQIHLAGRGIDGINFFSRLIETRQLKEAFRLPFS